MLEERLRHAGFQVERQPQVGFARLAVRDGARSTEVVLCYDVRLRPAETTGIGAMLAFEELAADKMLAFFTRALPRDLIDLHALAQRYGFDRLCEFATEKDRGFELEALAEALGSTQRLPEEAFEVADPEVVRELLASGRSTAHAGQGRAGTGRLSASRHITGRSLQPRRNTPADKCWYFAT